MKSESSFHTKNLYKDEFTIQVKQTTEHENTKISRTNWNSRVNTGTKRKTLFLMPVCDDDALSVSFQRDGYVSESCGMQSQNSKMHHHWTRHPESLQPLTDDARLKN